MTKFQGTILIALVFGGICLSAWSTYGSRAKYEYKVVRMLAESNERTGIGAMRFSSIQIADKDLASLGADGWELVGTLLDVETAFPNVGREEYVTGLQPNVRPSQRLCYLRDKSSEGGGGRH